VGARWEQAAAGLPAIQRTGAARVDSAPKHSVISAISSIDRKLEHIA
jgi:hypothetical protein